MKVLVVVIFAMSISALGFSTMVAYTNRDLSKRNSEVKREVGELQTLKKKLSEANNQAKVSDQGVEFWQVEFGKASKANDRAEKTEIPEKLESANRQFAQERTKFEKSEEDNIKAGERTLTEKLRSAKDLRGKVESAQKARDEAKKEIDEQEKVKRDLRNRLQQTLHTLDDVRKRRQELADQVQKTKTAVEADGK
jgi:chromosome segregation ATPase